MRIVLPAPDESVVLDGVSWEEFESILDELGDSRARRVAYDHGKLEIMSPSPLHERIAEIPGLLLHVLAEEFGLEVIATGSWTLRRTGLLRAVEGDKTFYIANERRFRAAGRHPNLDRIPPPDLAIEVDVTRKSLDRFPIYAALGVPEIWRYSHGALEVWQLRGAAYEGADSSLFFPGFPVTELPRFVELGLSGTVGNVGLMRTFREWVREQKGR